MRPLAWVAVALSVLGATLPGAAAEPDPWTRVPAFPTGCYQTDGFAEKLQAADEALTRDLRRQETINAELSEKLKAIDPMELASRQQQWMMEHPQEAAKLMQRHAQVGESVNAEIAGFEDSEALERELSGLDVRYNAALDKVLAPIEVKFKDLDVRAQKDLVVCGEQYCYAPWAFREYSALVSEENKAYERVCAEWWSASGPYHGWLKRYRDHQVQRIPAHEEAESVATGFMVVALGTPDASWKPTAALSAVHWYVDKVGKVFSGRRRQARGMPEW